MKRNGILAAAGLLPLVAGYLVNGAMLSVPSIPGGSWCLLGGVLLILWGRLAYGLADPGRCALLQALLLSAVGLGMLALVLYQELARGAYWSNLVGIGSQLYFLPFLSLASLLFGGLIQLVDPVIRVWPFYLLIWVVLFLTAFLGCRVKGRANG